MQTYITEVNQDRLLGLAAETAFFAVLSIFPGLLVAAGLLGVLDSILGPDLAARAQEQVVSALDAVLTGQAAGAISSVESLFAQTRGQLLTLAAAGALVTLSGAFAVVINALNEAYDTVERRTWLRRRLLGLGMALGTLLAVALVLTALVVGPLFGTGHQLAELLGFGAVFRFMWNVLRLPVVIVVLFLWAAALFHFAPNRRTDWRHAVPGAVVTTALWLLATAGFHAYIRVVAEGNPVLGAFGGGVIVMTWVYLLSIALLLGGEFNAVLRDRRHLSDR